MPRPMGQPKHNAPSIAPLVRVGKNSMYQGLKVFQAMAQLAAVTVLSTRSLTSTLEASKVSHMCSDFEQVEKEDMMAATVTPKVRVGFRPRPTSGILTSRTL